MAEESSSGQRFQQPQPPALSLGDFTYLIPFKLNVETEKAQSGYGFAYPKNEKLSSHL